MRGTTTDSLKHLVLFFDRLCFCQIPPPKVQIFWVDSAIIFTLSMFTTSVITQSEQILISLKTKEESRRQNLKVGILSQDFPWSSLYLKKYHWNVKSSVKFWSIWKYYCVINPWLIYLKILTHFEHFYNSILKGETFLRISCILWAIPSLRASLVKEDDKESIDNAGDPGSTPGSGRSPREGNGNPLQYSCLENSMDRGTWRAV